MDVIDHGVNGYLFEAGNGTDLLDKVDKFLSLDYEAKKQMGLAGRKKVEKEFEVNVKEKKKNKFVLEYTTADGKTIVINLEK